MVIGIASGKGGTGKTTIATNLALSLKNKVQLLDCDVEEPNCHLFFSPKWQLKKPISIPIPSVDLALCSFCGKCADICQYGAIVAVKERVLTFPELCHGCGGCTLICPEKAISEIPREIGYVEKGLINGLELVYGKLNIGEAMAPPLIRAVKENIDNNKEVIIDAPPGTSCPVIESIKGNDFVLLVTEPTPFGLNDLILAVEMTQALSIPFGVIINKADLGDQGVHQFCQRNNIPIILELPMDRKIAEAYSRGDIIIEVFPELKKKFQHIYKEIRGIIGK
jgi:MinD superfamily P-loop ATPase